LRVPRGVAAAGGIVPFGCRDEQRGRCRCHRALWRLRHCWRGPCVAFGAASKNSRRISLGTWIAKREELVAASSSNCSMRSIYFTPRSARSFAPLRAFCSAERKRYDPLLSRVRDVEKTLAVLSGRNCQTR
jgi:hypothetical protein